MAKPDTRLSGNLSTEKIVSGPKNNSLINGDTFNTNRKK